VILAGDKITISWLNQSDSCKDLCLPQVTDPRTGKNKLYPLGEILLLCVSGVVSGADGWKSIVEFGRTKLNWLRKFLIPSEDCIAWVMAKLSPSEFQECFVTWTESIAKLTNGEVVAIDGKTLRGSRDRCKGRSAIHMVSAWVNENRLSLGQVAVGEKSNKITAIPKLLKMLDIKEAGADYIFAVKGN